MHAYHPRAILIFASAMSAEINSTNPVVKAIVEGTAPRQARLAAARGILPLPQSDLLEILVAFAGCDDSELLENAKQTLQTQNTDSLHSLIAANEAAPQVLGYFARQTSLPKKLQEAILTNTRTPADAVIDFARTTESGQLLELLSLNQQLLIGNPAIIDAIIANPKRTAEAERRAAETKREFFEKERGAQQIADELRAQGKEAAAEFLESLDFSESDLNTEDALFIAAHIEVPDRETDDSWLALEYVEEIYEETAQQRQATLNKILGELTEEEGGATSERVSMLNRIMKMGVKDRVKLAAKGDREARNILIRDPNRLVSQAVANNPRITEQEVESIATMRSVPEDVLRSIASNRQWSRSYTISHNLVKNPRTPLGNAMTIMNRMQLRDLNALSKNKNVSDAVRKHAQRLTQARAGR
jgi:hypothetical protein